MSLLSSNVIGGMTIGGLIERRIIPSNLTSLSFSNLTQRYSSLLLHGMFETDRAGQVLETLGLRFNDDTGNNYDNQQISVLNATVAGAAGLAGSSITVAVGSGATAAADKVGTFQCLIPFYSNKNFDKYAQSWSTHFPSEAVLTNFRNIFYSGLWRNTTNITKLTIFTINGANILVNSRFNLYGIL